MTIFEFEIIKAAMEFMTVPELRRAVVLAQQADDGYGDAEIELSRLVHQVLAREKYAKPKTSAAG